MRVAHELGKFEYEVLSLPIDEFARWVAFFKRQDKQKQRQGSRRGNKSRKHNVRSRA